MEGLDSMYKEPVILVIFIHSYQYLCKNTHFIRIKTYLPLVVVLKKKLYLKIFSYIRVCAKIFKVWRFIAFNLKRQRLKPIQTFNFLNERDD